MNVATERTTVVFFMVPFDLSFDRSTCRANRSQDPDSFDPYILNNVVNNGCSLFQFSQKFLFVPVRRTIRRPTSIQRRRHPHNSKHHLRRHVASRPPRLWAMVDPVATLSLFWRRSSNTRWCIVASLVPRQWHLKKQREW